MYNHSSDCGCERNSRNGCDCGCDYERNGRNGCGCGCDCGCGCNTIVRYIPGPQGPRGPRGPQGIRGPLGPQGVAGGLLSYADFYALMPPNNPTAIPAGGDVSFPQTAVTNGTGITRISDTAFNLATPGTYFVNFNVSATEAGQLDLTLNGTEIPYTVSGKGAGNSQITGTSLITTTTPNSVLTVRNPAANTTVLTLTPYSGGSVPVSAHLVIMQVS